MIFITTLLGFAYRALCLGARAGVCLGIDDGKVRIAAFGITRGTGCRALYNSMTCQARRLFNPLDMKRRCHLSIDSFGRTTCVTPTLDSPTLRAVYNSTIVHVAACETGKFPC